MAWFGEGFSSLKGQISNFTKEIVVNNVVGLGLTDSDENEDQPSAPDDKTIIEHLKTHCKKQDEEVARLRAENERLLKERGSRERRVSEAATLECEGAGTQASSLPLVPLDDAGSDSFLGQDHEPKEVKPNEELSSLRTNLRKTFQEKVLMEQTCLRLEKEVAVLTRQMVEDREQALADVRNNGNNSNQSTQTEESCVSSIAPCSSDVAVLSREIDLLRRERTQMRSELSRLLQAVQELESQVAVSKDENANLSTGMEELDIQHQEAIEQIMVQRDFTQKRYEVLLVTHDDVNKKYEDALKLIEHLQRRKSCQDSECQISMETENAKSPSPVDLTEEIKNMITTDIPEKYFETSKSNASGMETIAAVEKMLSHTMAKIEASESKIKDLMNELKSRESDVIDIEDENKTLRSKIAELNERINNLPTITENAEDTEALERRVMALENEISIHQEVRSNLEVELNISRSEIESLIRQLQAVDATVGNRDNIQIENLKIKEQELLELLNSAEQKREEMLSEMSHLQRTVDNQERVISELNKNSSILEELSNENKELQQQLVRFKENELACSKLSEELQQEKHLRSKIEDEKEKLFLEFTKLQESEEQNLDQGVELQKLGKIKAQLEEENAKMQQKLISLQEKDNKHAILIEDLQNQLIQKNQLEETVDTMHAEIKRLEKECETHTQLLEQNSIESELKVKDLKTLNTSLTQKNLKLDKEMLDLSEKADKLQIEVDIKDRKLCEIILEKSVSDKNFDELKVSYMELENKLSEQTEEMSSNQETLCNSIKDAFSHLFTDHSLTHNDLNGLIQQTAKHASVIAEEKKALETENEALSGNIKALISEVNDKTECILKATAHVETLQAEKHSLEDRLRNVNESISIGSQTEQSERPDITLENFTSICNELEEYRTKFQELEEKYSQLLQSSDQSLNHVNEQLSNLNVERQQLIEAVQKKHSECLNYHAEIQRLCAELTKTETLRAAEAEQMEKRLEEKEEQLGALEGSSAKQVAALTEQLATLQHQLDYVSQLLRVTDRQEAEGQPASDSPTAITDSIKSDVEEKEAKRVNELQDSLQQEQLRNKYLQDEVSEQHEKEASLVRELERLRSHLVSVEDGYTQEMVRMEQQVSELTQRLSVAEERAKSSSTAYTSASIRANQQVESLSSQLRALTEQNEKVSAQLATAEDKLHKQSAALTNLQIVLEQFQRDKERDVAIENERIRQNLNQANTRISELTNEIKVLQCQLKEAKEGLSAASRLTEKLDEKSQEITELKQQVDGLLEKLKKAEERVQAASVNVEGKVDRCLVRNLLVGYLAAPPSSQKQALAIIASVLDFSQDDRQRSGLDPNAGLKHQSLSEAFVRFLENESKPQPQLHLPLQETEGSRSRKTSVSEIGLPPARRISGSVLKDVLKQDI